MAARARLLAIILGVPLLGLGVSTGVRAYFDSELRAAAVKQVPDAAPGALAAITVDRLCEEPSAETADVCGTNARLRFLRTASLASAGIGLALLLSIVLAGFAARSNRILLLRLFRPGLYLTAATITGLILAHAGIAIATIYYGESMLLNRVHGGVILAIGFGALAGVVAVARSAFGVVQKAEAFAIGRPVSPDEAPALWRQTEAVARKLGSLQPDHIVVGLDATFFVTEADVATLNGKLTGRTLFCSLPLARILTVEEFTSIVGHELGHFRGEDTRFSEHFYPIYRGTSSAIAFLHTAGGEGWGVVALLPAIAIFSFFLERFAVAESLHSRERELLADRAGAEATSPRGIASALVKVHAFADIWQDFQHAAAKALRAGNIYTNASATFAHAAANAATPAVLDGLADTHTSHPTDSHPPLGVRLASLEIELASVASEALTVAPSDSAATLIPDWEAHEEELSRTYQILLANQLGIELGSTQQQQEANAGPVQRCASCGTRVIPKQDGQCPSCGAAAFA